MLLRRQVRLYNHGKRISQKHVMKIKQSSLNPQTSSSPCYGGCWAEMIDDEERAIARVLGAGETGRGALPTAGKREGISF